VVELALDIFNEPYLKFESESPEIIAHFDKTQLVRITNNLVKNAIQAIPAEQKEKSILVAVKKSKNYVLISVSDNGKGIDIEDRKHVFEPKFTTKSSGMGLGLGIVKNIVEGYKGTITFETQTGKGTTFCVKLPI
jgi:signal transduction histidine kinase